MNNCHAWEFQNSLERKKKVLCNVQCRQSASHGRVLSSTESFLPPFNGFFSCYTINWPLLFLQFINLLDSNKTPWLFSTSTSSNIVILTTCHSRYTMHFTTQRSVTYLFTSQTKSKCALRRIIWAELCLVYNTDKKTYSIRNVNY